MEDKTVIITTLNAAWTAPNSIFDLFLESFRIGNNTNSLLNHVLVVALDQTAYSRCLEIHSHCYALITNGVDFSGEAHFMSDDYLKMMWRRIDFLRIVLQMGYNFIFTVSFLLSFPFTNGGVRAEYLLETVSLSSYDRKKTAYALPSPYLTCEITLSLLLLLLLLNDGVQG